MIILILSNVEHIKRRHLGSDLGCVMCLQLPRDPTTLVFPVPGGDQQNHPTSEFLIRWVEDSFLRNQVGGAIIS